jgi:hypothetical protein
MRKPILLASLVLGSTLAGCASQPQDIQAQYISPTKYNNFNCNQLTQEAGRLSNQVYGMTGSLKEKADTDSAQMAVGMLILWPTLFFLDGDGIEAQEYARLKGEVKAVDQSFLLKDCALTSKTQITNENEHPPKDTI